VPAALVVQLDRERAYRVAADWDGAALVLLAEQKEDEAGRGGHPAVGPRPADQVMAALVEFQEAPPDAPTHLADRYGTSW